MKAADSSSGALQDSLDLASAPVEEEQRYPFRVATTETTMSELGCGREATQCIVVVIDEFETPGKPYAPAQNETGATDGEYSGK